jgi:hypothetical protein
VGRQIHHRYTTDQSAFPVKVDNYRPNSVACSQIPITDPAKLPKPPKNGVALSGGERGINAAVMATRIGREQTASRQKVLAEKYNFSFAGDARSKWSDEKSDEQLQEVANPSIGGAPSLYRHQHL